MLWMLVRLPLYSIVVGQLVAVVFLVVKKKGAVLQEPRE